jgi:hypothetical protein
MAADVHYIRRVIPADIYLEYPVSAGEQWALIKRLFAKPVKQGERPILTGLQRSCGSLHFA